MLGQEHTLPFAYTPVRFVPASSCSQEIMKILTCLIGITSSHANCLEHLLVNGGNVDPVLTHVLLNQLTHCFEHVHGLVAHDVPP